ncbi:hypothetical protein PVAND_002618 [Polypedilum vanderplanki]|uniref:SET domain-containing protein n=1 Tax=Polypedilum vanderplanki TaxID=319348 RepID=A0A9J6BRI8_POLVA|nr:hypothetical protein PVAND_002618 [Polypedilum vanderplanki]
MGSIFSRDHDFDDQISDKTDIISTKYREEGNKYYSNSEFFKALVCYNKALAFAKSKELIALAYGNRSAVYFEIKRYDECLENIRFARLNSYPQEKIENLNKRKKKCLDIKKNQVLNSDREIWNYCKLSYPANKEIPWIIEGLEMRKTKKDGRGIYTTQDLQPGDIICIEEISAIFNLDENDYYNQCANCMKTKMLNLVPCIKSASFMFCSIECRNEFYSLFNFSSNEFNYLVFSLSKIERAFGGKKELEKYLQQNSHDSSSFFDINFKTASKSEIQLNTYKSLLSSSVPLMKSRVSFHRYDEKTNELLQKLYDIKFCNDVNCPRYDERVADSDMLVRQLKSRFKVNSVFSRFFGLINYKCVANVESVCVDNKIVCYVKLPIKANEQLFYNNLEEFYNFDPMVDSILFDRGILYCDCIACVHRLSAKDIKRENFNQPLPKALKFKDIKGFQDAIQKVKENFDIIRQYPIVTSLEYQISSNNIAFILPLIASMLTD